MKYIVLRRIRSKLTSVFQLNASTLHCVRLVDHQGFYNWCLFIFFFPQTKKCYSCCLQLLLFSTAYLPNSVYISVALFLVDLPEIKGTHRKFRSVVSSIIGNKKLWRQMTVRNTHHSILFAIAVIVESGLHTYRAYLFKPLSFQKV